MTTDYEKPLQACGLWERTSAKGNRYFTGRLGGLKVMVFENRDRKGDSDPTHYLCFGEALAKPASNGKPSEA